MSFKTKKIQNLFVATPAGDLALSPKSGEDPEIKPFVSAIEDTDDGMTNDGQLIINSMPARTYIQAVYGFSDDDLPLLKSINGEVPVNAVFTDGSIYSNTGVFVGEIVYNGTGTIELKFASAKDWIIQTAA